MKKEEIEYFFALLEEEAKEIGVRIHLLINLSVDHGRPFEQAASAATSYSPSHRNNAWNVEKQYSIEEIGVAEKNIILVSLENNQMSHEDYLKWGKKNGLIPSNPRTLFAIAEKAPSLDKELGGETQIYETTGMKNDLFCGIIWVHWTRKKHFHTPCVVQKKHIELKEGERDADDRWRAGCIDLRP